MRWMRLLVALAGASLGACNDGGGMTGSFVDGPVSGVTYETPSFTGVTDALGRFKYAEGETIEFRIGDTVLGQAVGKDTVTPFDLIADAEILVGDDINIYLRSPFSAVINLTVFLQTLDQDGDVDNGIEITEEVSALFEDVRLRFDHTTAWFHTGTEFREVLADINDLGLLDGTRDVRSPDVAIQHLYEVLEIEPRIYTRSRREQDDDADGSPETIDVYIFDEYGHRIRLERDSDGDGTADRILTETWNDNGQPLVDADDSNADGSIDSRNTCVYDEFGNEIRNERDNDADGTPDFIRTNEYDRLGRRIRQEQDNDADGTVESVTLYSYDGNITRAEQDGGADGTIDSVTITERNEYGFIVRTERDTDADGSPNAIAITEFDDYGRQLRFEDDADADGSPDSTRVTVYDENGHRLSIEHDYNGDEVVDRIERWTYDGDRLATYETDANGDGTAETISTYIYDEAGNSARIEVRELDVLASVQTREFDANGNPTRTEDDDNADETVDRITLSTYVQVSFAWLFDF